MKTRPNILKLETISYE